MIEILEPKECCGCSACYAVCPVRCISMPVDIEGFPYALADRDRCTDCGRCDRVCPVKHRFRPVAGKSIVYACAALDDALRMKSSSGGVFGALAEEVLKHGGVVFGARFDAAGKLVHAMAVTPGELKPLMGSKYLQSDMGDMFGQAKECLEAGRRVLFSGVPCQLAGLTRFLGCDYDNLLKVDILCHGVPSPKVFGRYLAENFGNGIDTIDFRNKITGWRNFSFTATYGKGKGFSQKASENPYMQGFLKGLYSRPSCYKCPAKSLSSGSDITLGDYWGVKSWHPAMDDNKGTSVVFVNSPRGEQAFDTVSGGFRVERSGYRKALAGNPSLKYSTRPNRYRARFFATFEDSDFNSLVDRLAPESKMRKLGTRVRKFLLRLHARI